MIHQRPARLVAVALAALAGGLAGCSSDEDAPSRTDQALDELQRLVDEAREIAPDDPMGWAREDLERYGDWEYRIVTVTDTDTAALESALNELGTERWEVYWVERTDGGLSLFLKRPAISYLRAIPFAEIGRVLPDSGAAE